MHLFEQEAARRDMCSDIGDMPVRDCFVSPIPYFSIILVDQDRELMRRVKQSGQLFPIHSQIEQSSRDATRRSATSRRPAATSYLWKNKKSA